MVPRLSGPPWHSKQCFLRMARARIARSPFSRRVRGSSARTNAEEARRTRTPATHRGQRITRSPSLLPGITQADVRDRQLGRGGKKDRAGLELFGSPPFTTKPRAPAVPSRPRRSACSAFSDCGFTPSGRVPPRVRERASEDASFGAFAISSAGLVSDIFP